MSATMTSQAPMRGASIPLVVAPSGVIQRFDALALSIGSRITVSTLMLGCVLMIIAGASSMLSALKSMNRDMDVINGQLAVINESNRKLNATLDSMPPSAASLQQIVASVRQTNSEVGASASQLASMAKTTSGLGAILDDITVQTRSMETSLAATSQSTDNLASTVTEVNRRIDPLLVAQRGTRRQVEQMGAGLADMNASLAYVIRTMNYLTAPPTGQGFTARVTVDKSSLPPIPGLKAVADPVEVFPRGVWPVYTGP